MIEYSIANSDGQHLLFPRGQRDSITYAEEMCALANYGDWDVTRGMPGDWRIFSRSSPTCPWVKTLDQ